MNKKSNSHVMLKNPRSGEVWICEDFTNRRRVDGNEFVEVRKPETERKVWINLNTLIKNK